MPVRPLLPGWETAPVPSGVERGYWTLEQPYQLAATRRAARIRLARLPIRVSEEAAEQVVLVLEELASNALRHGAPPTTIRLCQHSDGWLVIATDAAPGRFPVPALDRPAEQGGLGLNMVAGLTLRHGTDHDAQTKSVWALVAA